MLLLLHKRHSQLEFRVVFASRLQEAVLTPIISIAKTNMINVR